MHACMHTYIQSPIKISVCEWPGAKAEPKLPGISKSFRRSSSSLPHLARKGWQATIRTWARVVSDRPILEGQEHMKRASGSLAAAATSAQCHSVRVPNIHCNPELVKGFYKGVKLCSISMHAAKVAASARFMRTVAHTCVFARFLLQPVY